MKNKIHITGIFFLGLSFALSGLFAQGNNFLNSLEKRTEQKVEKKVQQNINKGVDNTINKAEKGIKDGVKNGGNSSSGQGGSEKTSTGSSTGTGTTTTTADPNADPIRDSDPNADAPGSEPGAGKATTSESATKSSVNSGASESSTKSAVAAGTSDFMPGASILFADDLAGDQIGDFPSNWNITAGGAEITSRDGGKALSFTGSPTEVSPKMNTKSYLPASFSIEFDAYMYAGKGRTENYLLKLAGQPDISISMNKVEMGTFNGLAADGKETSGWRHVSLSYSSRAIKVYLDQNRVLNIPNMNESGPGSFSISSVSTGANKGEPAMIRNVRVGK